MGYSTAFNGILYFTATPTPEVLADLKEVLGADCREHPEWHMYTLTPTGPKYLTWINLKLTSDNDGLEWDGSEKTYDMLEKVEFLIRYMRSKHPTFGLKGIFDCRGDESDDMWILHVYADGTTSVEGLNAVPARIKCPHCACEFDSLAAKSAHKKDN